MWSNLLGNLVGLLIGILLIVMRKKAINFLKSFFSTETVTPSVEKLMLIFYLVIGIIVILGSAYGLYQVLNKI